MNPDSPAYALALRPGPDPLEREMWVEAVLALIAYSKGLGPRRPCPYSSPKNYSSGRTRTP
jgi:hypothetical protein